MAKTKEKPSTSAYFRQQFDAHPEWLDTSDNSAVIEQWGRDHPGEVFAPNIRQSMSNIKSQLNKAAGKGRRHKKRKAAPTFDRIDEAPRAPRGRPPLQRTNLEQMELLLDKCLSIARQRDEEDLEGVIKQLRSARNAIVLKMGHAGHD